MKEKVFRKSDVILIAAVIIITAAGFLIFNLINSGTGNVAVVTVEGAEYAVLPLSEDTELNIVSPEGVNHLVIKGGQAWVDTADCHNQICVDTGKILEEGELIVCLPHKVVITIESR